VALPDSFCVVDTGGAVTPAKGSSVMILMKRGHMELYPNTGVSWKIPYAQFTGKGRIVFTREHLRAFCLKNITAMGLYFMAQDGAVAAMVFFATVFFIALAAYIFRFEKSASYGRYLKLAAFASTPVFLGTCLNAIAGARVPWVWHLCAFLSTLVMFRAVKTVSGASARREGP
jgi:hypothetical protein